jgi:hypothetical protein
MSRIALRIANKNNYYIKLIHLNRSNKERLVS